MSHSNQSSESAVIWTFLAIIAVILLGWGINIYELATMSEILSGIGALRIIGIFIPPIGAIMGYFV